MIIGGGIILLNLSLSHLVHRFRPKSTMNRYRDASWDVNELLEMQSTAFLAMHRRASSFCDPVVEAKAQVEISEKSIQRVAQESSRSSSK